MPKPQWHPPWKLFRVTTDRFTVSAAFVPNTMVVNKDYVWNVSGVVQL